MKKATLKNPSLRRSEYYKTPVEFHVLKRYYEGVTSFLGDNPNDQYLKEYRDQLLDDLNFQISNIIPSDKLSNLIIPIAGHCNLNCRFCTSFSPLVKEEIWSKEDIKKDLLRIKELGFQIREISIEGGEPFLHPELLEIVEITRKIFPSSVIVILTNGTLLKEHDESFYERLAELEGQIIIDNYFPDYDFGEFKRIAEEINLHYEINSCFSKEGYFFNLSLNKPENEYSFKDNLEKFIQCEKANKCITLLNHKLYTCGEVAYIFRLNETFNLNYPDDGIDIYKNDRNKISQFLARPCKLCGYCNFPEETSYNYKISEKKMEEWIKE